MMDNKQKDLVEMALNLCADAGLFSEMVKKHVYHGHAMDRRQMQAALDRIENDWVLADAWLSRAVEAAG
jgi:hypothetical protein